MTVYICMWSDVQSNFQYAEFNAVSDVLNWFANLLVEGFYNATIYKTIRLENEENAR